jgi:hypothetical protein
VRQALGADRHNYDPSALSEIFSDLAVIHADLFASEGIRPSAQRNRLAVFLGSAGSNSNAGERPVSGSNMTLPVAA